VEIEMSTIFVQIDTVNKTFDYAFDKLQENFCDIKVFFTNESDVENSKFSYNIKINNNQILSESFDNNFCYKESDIEILSPISRINFQADDEIEITFNCDSVDILFEDTLLFTAPKPQQPFSSWYWENKKWNPPIEHPEDGKYYKWDENIGWIEVKMSQDGVTWNTV